MAAAQAVQATAQVRDGGGGASAGRAGVEGPRIGPEAGTMWFWICGRFQEAAGRVSLMSPSGLSDPNGVI